MSTSTRSRKSDRSSGLEVPPSAATAEPAGPLDHGKNAANPGARPPGHHPAVRATAGRGHGYGPSREQSVPPIVVGRTVAGHGHGYDVGARWSRRSAQARRQVAAGAAILLVLVALPRVSARADEPICSLTAGIQFHACFSELRDDYRVARAVCFNLADDAAGEACLTDARRGRDEARLSCGEQLAARRELCGEIGELPYDPRFDPEDFESDFSNPAHPNPWFPLGVGNTWTYAGGDETVEIEVRDATKLIDGVRCIVVNDRVEIAGRLVEDTDDWFAQAKNGDVWYCGEEVKDFEFFAGDAPELPELVSIDGSFKAGRDGARAGIAFLANPLTGAIYRQEYSLGNAEDVARVLSETYAFGNDPTLDALVPEDLATLLCGTGTCVVTLEWAPLEPGAFARKYYAPGVGKFLEVSPDTGDIVQLVACNVAPACALLPGP